jgi:hypothetical protein
MMSSLRPVTLRKGPHGLIERVGVSALANIFGYRWLFVFGIGGQW